MSTTTMSDADKALLGTNPKLTDADIQKYNVKKSSLFKVTIAICAIYGVLALSILLLTIFSEKASVYFTTDIRPFTLTFVGGIIFIIIILIVQIVTFKPTALTSNTYDGDVCPDFWQLVKVEPSDTGYIAANMNDKGLLTYKCVPDANIYNYTRDAKTTGATFVNPYGHSGSTNGVIGNGVFTKPNPVLNRTTNNTTLNTYLKEVNTGKTANIVECDRVYPNYLASKNAQDSTINATPNLLAKTYAEMCGIPWTSMGTN
jgi:hypothetical protein